MQAIGIVLFIVGLALIAIAVLRGRKAGTGAAEGPPPPQPARFQMGAGILCVLVGIALTLMADV